MSLVYIAAGIAAEHLDKHKNLNPLLEWNKCTNAWYDERQPDESYDMYRVITGLCVHCDSLLPCIQVLEYMYDFGNWWPSERKHAEKLPITISARHLSPNSCMREVDILNGCVPSNLSVRQLCQSREWWACVTWMIWFGLVACGFIQPEKHKSMW
jgi:hypothetical protein